nr:hypothetical protein [Tanacetum cinerariifolium]
MTSFDYHLNPLYPIKECSSCGALYTTNYCCSVGILGDKIICDLDKTPDLSQRSPQNCLKCGNPVNGHYCQGCAFLRKKFKEDLFASCVENGILQDSFEPSNNNPNVVNAPRDPFVVNQDPELFQRLQNDVQNIHEELEMYINTPNWDRPIVCYDDDDEDYAIAVTPSLSTEKPDNSLSMGDEHLDTILATESDIFIKSSVENLVSNPSEFEGESKCDMPVCEAFTTFSNILFDSDYDFYSSDDQSFSDEDLWPPDTPVCYLCTCEQCGNILNYGIYLNCNSETRNSFTYDTIPESYDEVPNPPPQVHFNIYLCQICESNSHYGYECSQRIPLVYEPEPCCIQNFSDNNYSHDLPDCRVIHEPYQCQPKNHDYYHEQNSCYDSNSFGFDHCQPPQYTVNHPIFNAHNAFLDSQNELTITQNKIMEKMTQLTSMCEMACQIIQKKEEEKRIEEEQAASAQYWKIPACCDDDDDYSSAITPNEPVDSLSMRDKHLDTIPATESDEFIKSCVENLVPNQSESEGINETDCYHEEDIRLIDRLLYDNSSPRPPEEFVFENSNAEIESFSSSPIPNEDSDSHMKEIDLSFTPDDPMPPSIEDDGDDSERDILILEELPSNYSLSLLVNESFYFDIPSFSRPPAKPPDVLVWGIFDLIGPAAAVTTLLHLVGSQPMLKSSYKAEASVIISISPLVGGVADVVVEIKGTVKKGVKSSRSSGFFLIDRRAILDAMVWRHPGAAINDPRHAAGSFNMAVVRCLSAHVIKLRDMPEVIGIHDFLCLPECTGAEDLAAGTPSSKIIAKAEASQKRKASTSGVASSYVAKHSRGKGIMADDVVAPSAGVSRQRPSSEPTPSFRDVSGDDIHTDFFPFSASPYYATYPEDGVTGNCEFTREEWDAPYRPTFEVLTKEVFKDPAVCKTIVDQFPTLGEMVRVEGLSDDQLTAKMSVFHYMMMSHGGELFARYRGLNQSHHEYVLSQILKGYEAKSKAKEKEMKKKIKLRSKSLDNLHSEGLIQKFLASDEFSRVQGELLSLAASAGFKHGLTNVPIPRDTRVSPPIAKESIVTPNEQHVSTAVDGSNLKMIDGATHSKSGGVFVQGTSHALDDVAEVTVEGSERVSSSLTDVVVALSAGEKGAGSAPSSTVEEFGFAPSALLVALPFLLLLVSSTDGLVLISTDTFWLMNSSFIVASLVNTSAFRFKIFGRYVALDLLSFVQPDSFAFSILVRASRMGCFSSASFGMNLLMVLSCRNKLRIWFGLLGVRLRMIAYILPGSARSPSSITIWPKNLPSSLRMRTWSDRP